MAFGERLQEVRRRAGLTQEQFAEQLQESESSYLGRDHHDCKDKSEHKFFAFKIICVDGICSHGGEIGT